jgi:hypothetical protein
MTRCARLSRESEELLRFKAVRFGVAMTISGESASRDLWTGSETFWARLIARISFAQNDEKASTDL